MQTIANSEYNTDHALIVSLEFLGRRGFPPSLTFNAKTLSAQTTAHYLSLTPGCIDKRMSRVAYLHLPNPLNWFPTVHNPSDGPLSSRMSHRSPLAGHISRSRKDFASEIVPQTLQPPIRLCSKRRSCTILPTWAFLRRRAVTQSRLTTHLAQCILKRFSRHSKNTVRSDFLAKTLAEA